MSTKHTPGPWTIGSTIGTTKIVPAEIDKWSAIFTICEMQTGRDSLANARLIASAPELLDLAKAALAQLEKMDFSLSANWNGSIKTNVALLLSAAIAKAEGRE